MEIIWCMWRIFYLITDFVDLKFVGYTLEDSQYRHICHGSRKETVQAWYRSIFLAYLRNIFHNDGAWHLGVHYTGTLYTISHWKEGHNTICEEFQGPIHEIDKLSREQLSNPSASSIHDVKSSTGRIQPKI
jgi:hypothetical protein